MSRQIILALLPLLAAIILPGCAPTDYPSPDPNLSGVQARATLKYVQAIQTSTAQAQQAAEWQATSQAAATQDAFQSAYIAAQATEERLQRRVDATRTQQAWEATVISQSAGATATASTHATAISRATTATQAIWDREATAEIAGLQAQQTVQAVEAESAILAIERQRTINKVQAAAPWVVLGIVILLLAYLGWSWGNAEVLRRRAIQRDARGDAPILILDDHGKRNIIDPDLLFGPALTIEEDGYPSAPMLTAPEYQAQIKARDQAVDLVNRGLPDQPPNRSTVPTLSPFDPPGPVNKVRVVEPDEVNDWLVEVIPDLYQHALKEGELTDD